MTTFVRVYACPWSLYMKTGSKYYAYILRLEIEHTRLPIRATHKNGLTGCPALRARFLLFARRLLLSALQHGCAARRGSGTPHLSADRARSASCGLLPRIVRPACVCACGCACRTRTVFLLFCALLLCSPIILVALVRACAATRAPACLCRLTRPCKLAVRWSGPVTACRSP